MKKNIRKIICGACRRPAPTTTTASQPPSWSQQFWSSWSCRSGRIKPRNTRRRSEEASRRDKRVIASLRALVMSQSTDTGDLTVRLLFDGSFPITSLSSLTAPPCCDVDWPSSCPPDSTPTSSNFCYHDQVLSLAVFTEICPFFLPCSPCDFVSILLIHFCHRARWSPLLPRLSFVSFSSRFTCASSSSTDLSRIIRNIASSSLPS